MFKIIKQVEHAVVLTLLGLMMIVVVISTLELGWLLVKEILNPSQGWLLNISELFQLFGFFLMVLIGLELIETLTAYMRDDRFHAEVVFLVAMIAVTRKVIILDYRVVPPATMYGVAALVFALSAGYFLVKLGLRQAATPRERAAAEKPPSPTSVSGTP